VFDSWVWLDATEGLGASCRLLGRGDRVGRSGSRRPRKPKREGEQVWVSSICDWIDERGLRKEWQKLVWIKKEMAEMEIIESAGDLPPTRGWG